MRGTIRPLQILGLGLLLALAGCGGKPMPFPTPESELGSRPGLLTGDSGTWQIPLPSLAQPPADRPNGAAR